MTKSPFSISGLRTVVTGASRGIGAAIADRFSSGGAEVVVCSREYSNVRPVAERLEDETGNRALAVECDVRNRNEVEELMETTVSELGGVDVLINNAGASFVTPFEEISENGWKTVMDINLGGVYRCTQVAGEHMRSSGGGSIINIGSIAGEFGAPNLGHYGAAKAGVINLTKTAADEWAEYDVRVNCISPGMVATEEAKEQLGLGRGGIDRRTVDRTVGTPEEIASIAQFLASPASSYMVGENVIASGTQKSAVQVG